MLDRCNEAAIPLHQRRPIGGR